MAKTNIKSKKIIVLILMMLALATIYVLPYLRYTFYIPLQEAMNLVGENKKYGMLTSIYGIANFLLYIPGGWMADRFDPKKLMAWIVAVYLAGLHNAVAHLCAVWHYNGFDLLVCIHQVHQRDFGI